MIRNFHFDSDILASMTSGRSALDIRFLNIANEDQAESFLRSYGFDTSSELVQEKLWHYHRRSIVLLTERLGFSIQEIPEVLRDRKDLKKLTQLLIFASDRRAEASELQRWSCALLRAMHVYVHSENDLLNSFAEEIQKQILTPFDQSVSFSGAEHAPVLVPQSSDLSAIELVSYTHKPLKTSSSTVIKLLAKSEALAMNIYDKVGVRFVTKTIFDSFQVLRFLWRENLISFAHIMPDQSSNNIYPSELFLKICQELSQDSRANQMNDLELDQFFHARWSQVGDQYKTHRKENSFSGQDYRFVKFISRKLIRISNGEGKEDFSFFYPFEVQILDQATFNSIQTGPSEHEQYKVRQQSAARERLFPSNGLV